MPCHEGCGGIAEDVQLLPDLTVSVVPVVESAVCQQTRTKVPVSISLVTAVQLMIIQVKGTPTVHCRFEAEQPREDAVAELCPHLWPLALDQVCCGKLSALYIQVLPEEGPASHSNRKACCYHDSCYLCALELVGPSESCCVLGVLAEAFHVLFCHCNKSTFGQELSNEQECS